MGANFRPVMEVWNDHFSSCFVPSEQVITLLHDLAARWTLAARNMNMGKRR
jgi:hypothetical protein